MIEFQEIHIFKLANTNKIKLQLCSTRRCEQNTKKRYILRALQFVFQSDANNKNCWCFKKPQYKKKHKREIHLKITSSRLASNACGFPRLHEFVICCLLQSSCLVYFVKTVESRKPICNAAHGRMWMLYASKIFPLSNWNDFTWIFISFEKKRRRRRKKTSNVNACIIYAFESVTLSTSFNLMGVIKTGKTCDRRWLLARFFFSSLRLSSEEWRNIVKWEKCRYKKKPYNKLLCMNIANGIA